MLIIVAGEMCKLAEQCKNIAEHVEGSLMQIQQNIAKVAVIGKKATNVSEQQYASTKEVTSAIDEISGKSKELVELFKN